MFTSSSKLPVTAPDDPNAVIALLEAKVKNLTEQLQQQQQQKQHEEESERSNGIKSHAVHEQEKATISQLTEHLDEKNGEINTLKARLADQGHENHNLRGRLAMALAGKSAVETQLATVEKQRDDQHDRLAVLQNLTKVQADVVEELHRQSQQQQESEEVRAAIENGDYEPPPGSTTPKQGGMHGQLYKLMTHSSELSQQVEEQNKRRVAAEQQTKEIKQLNEQLRKQVEEVTVQLTKAQKQKAAKHRGKDKDNKQKGEAEEEEEVEPKGDEDHIAFLLPEIHQLLDSFNDGAGDGDTNGNDSSAAVDTGSMSKEEQRQHLIESLQVYQTQVKRLQQDVIQHWDKTARVSVALAEAKMNIDDLNEKVDYYETILEKLLGDRLHSYHLEQAQKKEGEEAPQKPPEEENTGLLARFFRRVVPDDASGASSVSSGDDMISLSSDTTSDIADKRAQIQKKLSEKSKKRAQKRVKKRQQVIHKYLEQIEQDHGPSGLWDSSSSLARENLEEVALEEEGEEEDETETEEDEDQFVTGGEAGTPPALERNESGEEDGPRRVSFSTDSPQVSVYVSEADPEKRMKQVKRKSNTRAIVDPYKNKENNANENGEEGAEPEEDGKTETIDEGQEGGAQFEDSSEDNGEDFMKEYLREAGLPEKPRKAAHPWK